MAVDEMQGRVGDLSVEQFTALLIKVIQDVVDEKLQSTSDKSTDTEELRKQKIEAILNL